jgi:hypothetical protein
VAAAPLAPSRAAKASALRRLAAVFCFGKKVAASAGGGSVYQQPASAAAEQLAAAPAEEQAEAAVEQQAAEAAAELAEVAPADIEQRASAQVGEEPATEIAEVADIVAAAAVITAEAAAPLVPSTASPKASPEKASKLRRAAAAVKTSISAVFRPKAGTPGPGTPDITPLASRRTTDSSFESPSSRNDVNTTTSSNNNTGSNSGGDIGRKCTRPLSPTIAAIERAAAAWYVPPHVAIVLDGASNTSTAPPAAAFLVGVTFASAF